MMCKRSALLRLLIALFTITVFSLFTFTTLRQAEALTIRNLSVASGKTYQVVDNGLVNGAVVYIDRSYTFTSIPAALQAATYIKTANDDKGFSAASFLSFNVDEDVIVYVAHDDAIGTRPSWLSAFNLENDNIVTTDTTLSLFSSFFDGNVTLGGNEGGSNSMYSVVVVGTGAGGDVVPPTVTITSPTAESTYTTSSSNLDIGGTASDETGVTAVTWSNDRGGSGAASGTTNWNVSGILLQEGTNVITVTARDLAGNNRTDTLTVTYNITTSGGMPYLPQAWSNKIPGADRWVLVLDGKAVLDKETGLVWEQSPSTDTFAWVDALTHCYQKKVGGRFGWRTPTIEELATLVDDTQVRPTLPSGHPFSSNVQSEDYWSSTTIASGATNYVWGVYFFNGSVTSQFKDGNVYVWCVRGSQGNEAY